MRGGTGQRCGARFALARVEKATRRRWKRREGMGRRGPNFTILSQSGDGFAPEEMTQCFVTTITVCLPPGTVRSIWAFQNGELPAWSPSQYTVTNIISDLISSLMSAPYLRIIRSLIRYFTIFTNNIFCTLVEHQNQNFVRHKRLRKCMKRISQCLKIVYVGHKMSTAVRTPNA